ncbi:TPA: hypothetical protein DEP96_02595 [Candidatus Uhrbacteria bacterium]|nr:hypothetical protein [Candidatus Uhrbacteria bacterium]
MLSQRLKETKTYQRLAALAKKYERFTMPLMLLGGTATDALQFRLLSLQTTIIISVVYSFICAVAMMIIVAPVRGNNLFIRYARLAAPFLQQFTIGSLLSTALLFYWFSGSFSISWPIIGLIAAVMIVNEAARHIVTRPDVQFGIFSFAIISLSSTLSAYLFNSLEPWVFIVGVVVSLILLGGYLVPYLNVGERHEAQKKHWLIVVGLAAFLTIFYFLNVIPPIPLSLREASVAYNVARSNGEYLLVKQPENWFEKLIPSVTMTIKQGDPIYAFTVVSAPADLQTTLVHNWEYYDPDVKKWVTKSVLSYQMTGGLSDGYHGYSYKTSLLAGKWRVAVQTMRGQVLARIPFFLVYE